LLIVKKLFSLKNKSLVIGAGENQVFLLICRTSEKEISALVVDSDSKGITLSKKPETLGFRAIPIRDVTFIDCRVPKKNLLGKRGEGFKYAMKVLEHERLNIGKYLCKNIFSKNICLLASCALGGATFCLKQAIAHYKMTKTKLIHQEFEFKLSDLACKLMACKLLLRQAATALDNKEIKAFQLSAQTKWFVPFTSFEVFFFFF
jgi:alkylation response protein AidB-like acyl-CoA dehydrogenase